METVRKLSFTELAKITIKEPSILLHLVEKYGDTFLLSLPGCKVHIFTNPNYIKHIFSIKPENYIKDPRAFESLKDFLGAYGLVTVTDRQIWEKDREVIAKLFSKEKMEEYAKIMAETSIKLINNWETLSNNGKPVCIDPIFTEITFYNVLHSLFSGVNIDPKPLQKVSRQLMYLASPFLFPFLVKFLGKIPLPTPFFFKYQKAKKKLRQIGEEVVRQSFNEGISDANLIKCLAKAYGFKSYESLSPQMKCHLVDEAVTFILAGHETTAATLVNVFVMLSLYPMMADKINEEINNVLGQSSPTFATLEKLPLTRAMIQETLRLSPPATGIARKVVADDTIKGYEVKKGDVVLISTYVTQRHPRYWYNAEGFDPNRFLEPLTDDQRWMHIPFGLGEHACLGAQFSVMESMIVLVLIVQRFGLSLTAGCSLEHDPGMVNRLNPDVSMHITKKN